MSVIWSHDLTFLWQACFEGMFHGTFETYVSVEAPPPNKKLARKIPPATRAYSNQARDSWITIDKLCIINKILKSFE